MSFGISAGVAVLLLGSGAAQTPPVSPARAQLDEVRRLASVLDYPAAMTLFESVQANTPAAIESLDGLKIQIVYLETGHTDKFLNLERWMIARYKSPKVSTDAERSVKGYLIWKGATDDNAHRVLEVSLLHLFVDIDAGDASPVRSVAAAVRCWGRIRIWCNIVCHIFSLSRENS